jgi:hypothetical protein
MPLNKVKVSMIEGLDGVGGDGTNAFTVNEYVGDGVETDYTLSVDPLSIKNTQVYVSGVYQSKDTYTLDGTTLTFSQAPPYDRIIEVVTATAVIYESADFVNVIGDTMTGDLQIDADLRVRDGLSFTNGIDISHGNIKWLTGEGDPEGAISASVGSIYSDSAANSQEPVLFVKETGDGPTGWAPAGTGAGGADGDGTNSFSIEYFTGDGVEVNYTLNKEPISIENTQVYLSGVYQSKLTYTLLGRTLTFSEVPPDGCSIEVVLATVVVFTDSDYIDVEAIIDEDDMISDSDQHIPTQQSVKAYVDQSMPGMFKGNGGTIGTGKEDIFRVNSRVINTDITIEADENASAAGPLQIADSVALKVEGVLTIV